MWEGEEELVEAVACGCVRPNLAVSRPVSQPGCPVLSCEQHFCRDHVFGGDRTVEGIIWVNKFFSGQVISAITLMILSVFLVISYSF